jgi:hypothetical protein
MPRKARIDAPGALQHIIARGIERRKTFIDDTDRDDFLTRLGVSPATISQSSMRGSRIAAEKGLRLNLEL